ncbi:hypothetical protein GCM10027442_39020 [Emticicia fontis]
MIFALSDSAAKHLNKAFNVKEADKVKPTGVQEKPLMATQFAKWGDNNLWPQDTKELIKQSFVLKTGFKKRFNQVYAGGLVTKVWEIDGDGKEVLVKKRVPEFQEFLKRNSYGHTYTMQVIRDLLRFYIAFPEFVTSVDKSQILMLKAQKATQCRLSLQNTEGIVENCFVNPDWAKIRNVDSPEVKKIPVVEDDYFAFERMKQAKGFNFIYPLVHAADEGYYPDPDWLSTDLYDHIDISTSWAKFVKHLMQNAAIINYVVNIKDWYWEHRFGSENWNKLKPDEKAAKRKAEIEGINKNITGIEKVGKMLLVDVKTKLAGAMRNVSVGNIEDSSAAFEVKVLEQPKTDQTFLEAYNSANRSIQHAIGLDSSAYGPLSGEGDKGGSDKQQGYNISLISDQYIRELVLKAPRFIRDYNGWSQEVEIEFDLPVMQTSAAISPAKRNIQPSDK